MQLNPVQSTALHFVRFLCSQAVFIAHLIHIFAWPFPTLMSMASYAVLLFFILSGFLITTSTQQRIESNPDYHFIDFFRDRFFRIYPPFLAALIMTFTLDVVSFEWTNQIYSLKQYFINLFVNVFLLQEFPPAVIINEHFTIEFFRFRYFGSNLPLWTISIEWWIYLFFGFGYFYFARASRVKIRHTIILLLLSITPLYYVFVSVRMDNGLTLYWFLGALIAYSSKGLSVMKNSTTGMAATILLIGGMTLFPKIGYHNSAVLFALGLTLFISCNRSNTASIQSLSKLSQFLAGYSYSLYLIHYPIVLFIITLFPAELNGTSFFLVYVIVNIIAFGFAQVFENHSNKLKKMYENYRPYPN